MTDLKRAFEEQGYVVIPGLLSREESDHYRAEIQKVSGFGDAEYGSKLFECPDGASKHRAFWPLIDHPKLVEAVRAVLGPTARYTQHSDLHVHRQADRPLPGGLVGGWHRDSACRDFGVGPDWDESREPYLVTRVAIYLQSFAESGSSLGVIPASHLYERRATPGLEARLWSTSAIFRFRTHRLLEKAGLTHTPHFYYHPKCQVRTRRGGLPLLSSPTEPVWIATEPGDTILFNQRLFHAASPIHGPKYAVFLSYSPENEHARNHLRYYRHVRTDLGYGPLDPELEEQLKAQGLYMETPPPGDIAGATRFETMQSAR